MSAHEHGAHRAQPNGHDGRATAVLHVGELHNASKKAVVERVLANRPGVEGVEANPVAQTATVEYDPATTSLEALLCLKRRPLGRPCLDPTGAD